RRWRISRWAIASRRTSARPPLADLLSSNRWPTAAGRHRARPAVFISLPRRAGWGTIRPGGGGMNILKSLAVKNVEEATRAIPIIDFAPAFRSGADGASGLEAVAAQVRRASETVGFFYMAGHGVPADVVDAAFAASREFHALPMAEKM